VLYIQNPCQKEIAPDLFRAKIGIAKARQGDRGWVDVAFNKKLLLFRELTTEDERAGETSSKRRKPHRDQSGELISGEENK
jgi:hypothetical protein